MRIAILAHVRRPIAQPFAGGMESHCWELAAGLEARGHDVTLFASGDSDPRFTIDPVVEDHYEVRYSWEEYRETAELTAYLDDAYRRACERIAGGGFDVVHNNSLHRFPLERRWTALTPTVTSLHVPPFDALKWFVQASVAPSHRITVTSHRQLHAWWPDGAPAEASVLHNGVDETRWPFVAEGDGSAVWCGRITPNKGAHLAIRAVRLVGMPLTLYGPIEDADYWAREVEPLLGGAITYGGHLPRGELAAAIGRASVFLFTPYWDEPFGLVAAEAMACGVPVAALDMGAAREIVAEAGVIAEAGDSEALSRAIVAAMAIDRETCRQRVIANFTRDRWLEACEGLYEAAIGGHAAESHALLD